MAELVFKNTVYNYTKITKTDIANAESLQLKYALQLLKKWYGKSVDYSFKTSGSTGKAKKITFTKNQIITSADITNKVLQLTHNDVFLVCLSANFVAGTLMLVRAILLNAKIILAEPIANPLLNLLDEKITFAAFVPLQVEEILVQPKTKKYLQNITQIIIGGADINASLEEKIAHLKPVKAYHTYGMTETLTHIALRKIGSEQTYTALPGTIIKQAKNKCLCIKNKVTNNHWIATNDLVKIYKNKRFKVLGRIDFIINSGAYKINPFKVENALIKTFKNQLTNTHFFVGSIKDNKLGNKCMLFVERNQDLKINLTALEKDLHKYEIPKGIIALEAFIYTPSGKINRKATMQHTKLQHIK